MKKRMRFYSGLALMICAAIICGGCSSLNEKTQKATRKSHTVMKSIGTASNTMGTYKIKLENKTGKAITVVNIRDSVQYEYNDNMLEENDSFAVNETRYLYYDATNAVDAAQDQAIKKSKITYDLRVTLSDGSRSVLQEFPFGKMKNTAQIYYDKTYAICYLRYQSKETGKWINTRKAEIANEKGTGSRSSASSGNWSSGASSNSSGSRYNSNSTSTQNSGNTSRYPSYNRDSNTQNHSGSSSNNSSSQHGNTGGSNNNGQGNNDTQSPPSGGPQDNPTQP
ncbi:hypothetical protein HMP0721_1026 [Pseudoramibacter alactolyticus ATCC 23263]|uniref:DUF4352 domain-containing protein n=1 Tax=Pseudoramibacter alactolyticus ATCC 23263 TaxID=887929 RepID=E6MG93_9FIRM|nr:hypothetical protein [Pseudoramibacter alactolyticus]EFV01633.1 hypothetical protein HMP0721_1026 [Pseudoramibacter alactolyticus ATCC 23263]